MQRVFDFAQNKEDNLLRKFEEIHDYIYSHEGLTPQETLEEFVKILFIKIYDETGRLNLFSVKKAENDNNMESIYHLFELVKENYCSFFDPHDKIKLSANSLLYITAKLQNISLTKSSQDVNGLAFQKFINRHEKSDRGQFFTPEPVINFCIQIINPKPNEKILDPACGSGGFLLSALKHLGINNVKGIINKNIYGVDINKIIARIAIMKLLLECNTKNNIICYNSLEDIDCLERILNAVEFDVIMTNPPFGAKINDNKILKTFDLGKKWLKNNNEYIKSDSLVSNQAVETLFIERCIDLLKTNGRMAIVLPNGNFENPSLDYVRYYILRKTKILAIVNLPAETFIPYGTGVKTSLIFLEKNNNAYYNDYKIFFAKITKLGYQGNKNGTVTYKKDSVGNNILDSGGLPIIDEDYTDIINEYKKFIENKNISNINCFIINSKELMNRFDYDFYSPANKTIINNKNKAVKLGDICEIIKSKSAKLKNPGINVDYVELSDVNANTFEIVNSRTFTVHELPSRASYEILDGDIITAIAGNSVGTKNHATALVTTEYSGCICTNGFRIIRNPKIDPYYLLYYMKSEKFLKQMFMYRTGAAIPAVSDVDLYNIIIEIPDKNTIKNIVEKMKKVFNLRMEAKKEYESIAS